MANNKKDLYSFLFALLLCRTVFHQQPTTKKRKKKSKQKSQKGGKTPWIICHWIINQRKCVGKLQNIFFSLHSSIVACMVCREIPCTIFAPFAHTCTYEVTLQCLQSASVWFYVCYNYKCCKIAPTYVRAQAHTSTYNRCRFQCAHNKHTPRARFCKNCAYFLPLSILFLLAAK